MASTLITRSPGRAGAGPVASCDKNGVEASATRNRTGRWFSRKGAVVYSLLAGCSSKAPRVASRSDASGAGRENGHQYV